ncbi:MAG TPA: DNA methyltransferase, partial [Chloroflexota bacterium]|nr:DNA methyltransferase [Chloroflexota bacterium]
MPPSGAALSETLTVKGDLPLDRPIDTGQRLLIISNDQSWLTHGFHRYPAKFFPELPRWAIRKYSSEWETVLDPMAGSGTVNLESLLNQRHSIAIDVDPFARLLAKVKTTALDADVLERAYDTIAASLDSFAKGGAPARRAALEAVPEFPYRETWFQPFILEEIGAVRHAIQRVQRSLPRTLVGTGGAETQDYVDFFRICLSSIVRDVSNADNNCTRTVVRKRLNKRIVPGMALRLFGRVAGVNIQRMRAFSELRPRHVRVTIPPKGDARRLPVGDASVDVAVTSPPYINAVDYPRTHQLEMYLLDLTPPGQPLAEAKRAHIGTEVVRAADYKELHRYGLPELDSQVERFYAIDKRRAYIVHRYFVDMETNFREVRRALKPG